VSSGNICIAFDVLLHGSEENRPGSSVLGSSQTLVDVTDVLGRSLAKITEQVWMGLQ